MDKLNAIEWADKKLAEGEPSDGCTLAPDFNFKKCCQRHDVMIRFNQGITNREADQYLRECIIDHGHPFLAWVYWIFTRYSNIVGGWQNAIAISIGVTLIGSLILWG